MFIGDRTSEIFYRAAHREVTVIMTMYVPGIDSKADIRMAGAVIEDRKLFTPKDAKAAVTQAAHVWKFDDVCAPAIEKSPAVLDQVRRKVQTRTEHLNTGKLRDLTDEEQRVIFDSEDIIHTATGLPPVISIDFTRSAERRMLEVSMLPFPKIKNLLLIVGEKLQAEGGALHDVSITHKSAISAADYHQISFRKYYYGWRPEEQDDDSLDAAKKMLDAIGVQLRLN